jgi:hypothetical protein
MMSISLVQDRDQCGAVVNAVTNLRFVQNLVSFLTRRETISLSRIALLHVFGYLYA